MIFRLPAHYRFRVFAFLMSGARTIWLPLARHLCRPLLELAGDYGSFILSWGLAFAAVLTFAPILNRIVNRVVHPLNSQT